jgi:hypothetical protein
VTVDVITHPCTVDTISYNTTVPSASSALFKLENGIPIISINEPTSSKPFQTINVYDRFVKGTTLSMCDYVDFKIEKVLKGSAILPSSAWSSLFSIDNLGNLKIRDFSKSVTDYKVFVSPFNGKIWMSLPRPLASITLTSSTF